MSSTATDFASTPNRILDAAAQVALIVGGSLLVAVCARVYIPLPGTPVPLTLENLGVLLVGLALGSRRGFVAMALYLAEGAGGMPVFSQGLSGVVHLFGPTGGYLLAYPFVAALTGFMVERGGPTFARAALAAAAGELVLFACGISWLYLLTHSLAKALSFGLYWFIFAEIIKVGFAAGAFRGWHSFFPRN
jgi:biotin transport system substrate-specific component